MLIYDRRRCRPLRAEETRRRLTLSQRARLGLLERDGWQLLFVRGEPSTAFLSHELEGYGMLGRDGRLIGVRALPQRGGDAVAEHEARLAPAEPSPVPVPPPLPAQGPTVHSAAA